MASTGVFRSKTVTVIDYCCEVRPDDAPFVELHDSFSLAYVRKGSFGCRAQGRSFELVPGAILIGLPATSIPAPTSTPAAMSACRFTSRRSWSNR